MRFPHKKRTSLYWPHMTRLRWVSACVISAVVLAFTAGAVIGHLDSRPGQRGRRVQALTRFLRGPATVVEGRDLMVAFDSTDWRYQQARTAPLFRSGRSQAVRLPPDFRFEGRQVFVRRDPATGDVVLSNRR